MSDCTKCIHEKACQAWINHGKIQYDDFEYSVEGCLNFAPTVEVVHAHWEDGYGRHNDKEVYKSIDCSHCNEIFKIESETREYWKDRFKVCPFCGAVMDGGNEDE